MMNEMIYGVQYYRAPTPVREDWERDLQRIHESGFNTVKIWALWRKNHPQENVYDFEDLDELMRLIGKYELKAVINIIMDAAPAWLYQKYPESVMEMANGQKLYPRAPLYRQLGGAPGPCYHHKEAALHKYAFIEALAKRYADCEQLLCWDLWNEPELTCGLAREAKQEEMVCYCESSIEAFREWLKKKYRKIEKLNDAWKRNYRTFSEAEAPRCADLFNDMIDWRTFFAETLTEDLKKRVDIVKKVDSRHAVMVHTVPMPYFNMMNACCDDYQMAELCDMYGNSIGSEPYMAVMTACAAGEKISMSAELHILGGNTFARTPVKSYIDFKRYIYTPLAHGMKGFLYWQYRPERCGMEGPAWGLTTMDGGSREYLEYASRIGKHLKKYADALTQAKPIRAQIVLIRDNRNEIFSWCVEKDAALYQQSLLGAFDAFYEQNYQVDIKEVSQLLKEGMESYALAYYPFPYYMTSETALMLQQFVQNGGTLIAEAFFGAYEGEKNFHSLVVPGYGFDEIFGAREENAFSAAAFLAAYGESWRKCGDQEKISFHGGILGETYEFVGYRFAETFQMNGGCAGGFTITQRPMISVKGVGKGNAVLCGTLLGAAYKRYKDAGTLRLFDEFAELAKISKNVKSVSGKIRVDILRGDAGGVLVLRSLEQAGCRIEIAFSKEKHLQKKNYVNIESGEIFTASEAGIFEVEMEAGDIMVLVEV